MLTTQNSQPPVLARPLSKQDLIDGFRRLGLDRGDTVLVQSSYKAFGGVEGGPRTVLEALLEVLGPEGTLIKPTFNWDDFGEKKLYSKRHTKPQTGIMCEMLMQWPGVRRIYHPIHGFSLVGRLAEELSQTVKNESSFESSSLFGELHRRNAKIMLMGVNYRKGLTFFHYMEEAAMVPYRKFITLEGGVEETDGRVRRIRMKYFGRSTKDVKYDLDKVQACLEEQLPSVVATQKIGLSTVKSMRAADIYDRIMNELRQNPNLVVVDEWPAGFLQPKKHAQSRKD